uniref:DNA-directed RNA polymerase n=1 Tax=Caulerpa okamurae TaxID=118247 RepID=A0A3S6I4H3_9CHLO|nr:RNA polymerase beta subunit [Caulerpa okamurae]
MKINQYQNQIYLGWKKFFFNFKNLNLYINLSSFIKTRAERQRKKNIRGLFWKRLLSQLNYNKYSKESPRGWKSATRREAPSRRTELTRREAPSRRTELPSALLFTFLRPPSLSCLFSSFACGAKRRAPPKGVARAEVWITSGKARWQRKQVQRIITIVDKHSGKAVGGGYSPPKDSEGGPIFFKGLNKTNQNTYLFHRGFAKQLQWVQKGDLLADSSASSKGELALGKNLLAAYMPWEGLNFEDAVLINQKVITKYTSLHIEKYDVEILENEKLTSNLPLRENPEPSLEENGIIKIGSWVQEGDILVGKITSRLSSKQLSLEKENLNLNIVQYEQLLYDIVGQDFIKIQENSLRVPSGISGRIIKISICYQKETFSQNIRGPFAKVVIYIATQRELKVGDKISGRHGNKGILSKIFGNYDMPFLLNGECLDILLNPLGVPSRMNVGQILECILGLTGHIFQTKFQTICFDEMNGYEASRSLIYSKLLKSANQTKQKWLFSKKRPGKVNIFDGRDGLIFHQSVLVGYAYIMKLIHIVDEKINARSTGAYSLITQQPLRGRAKQGGQRVGEMEVWALQGFGSAYTLQELLTVKSDDLMGRNRLMLTLLKNTPLNFGTPESLRVVLRELQSLCLDLNILC